MSEVQVGLVATQFGLAGNQLGLARGQLGLARGQLGLVRGQFGLAKASLACWRPFRLAGGHLDWPEASVPAFRRN